MKRVVIRVTRVNRHTGEHVLKGVIPLYRDDALTISDATREVAQVQYAGDNVIDVLLKTDPTDEEIRHGKTEAGA